LTVKGIPVPLSATQIQDLEHAIRTYSFPLYYFDYALPKHLNPQIATGITQLELLIKAQLLSSMPSDIARGLGNIIYWGNATAGYRYSRFAKFNSLIGSFAPYTTFNGLVSGGIPSLTALKQLGLPSYSNISFVSKILMFLNPWDYCVLDLQISKLKKSGRSTSRALDRLTIYPTSIPITRANEQVYDLWRSECRHISSTYYGGTYRVADVERGFFQLIKSDQVNAHSIYDDF
jgi:hypothetical protein